jgi:hypothetical protein
LRCCCSSSSSSSMLLFILVIASMNITSMAVLKFLSLNISIQEKRKKIFVPNSPSPKLPHQPLSIQRLPNHGNHLLVIYSFLGSKASFLTSSSDFDTFSCFTISEPTNGTFGLSSKSFGSILAMKRLV